MVQINLWDLLTRKKWVFVYTLCQMLINYNVTVVKKLFWWLGCTFMAIADHCGEIKWRLSLIWNYYEVLLNCQ